MAKRVFEFELYRINLVQAEATLFEEKNKPIKTNHIREVLEHAVQPDFKVVAKGHKNTFEWAVRDSVQYGTGRENGGDVYGITLARSVIQTAGEIVTDTGIENGLSEAAPPLADTARLFFYMKRHLMVIEHRPEIVNSRWKPALEDILKAAAKDLQFSGWLEFEPVPRHEEIIEAFRSFERLTRLRLILRLPNPELSRYSQQLYEEMRDGKIREYLQDMQNPQGLNKDDGKLPHAATEIAAAGYKRGEVTFMGTRKGKVEKVRTGSDAAHGQVTALRDYVRGMKDAVKAKETQRVMASILDEIDRIAPPPSGKA